MSKITTDVWLDPVWYRMLYSCTHMATVGVEGLKEPKLEISLHHVVLLNLISPARLQLLEFDTVTQNMALIASMMATIVQTSLYRAAKS